MAQELLDLIETIRAEDAYSNTWQRDGVNIGQLAAQRGQDRDRYNRSLVEAAKLLQAVLRGRLPTQRLKEAMSTSDFPLLFGDILDRQMLGRYQAYPSTFRQYMRVASVPDFRDVKRFTIDGAEGQLEEVRELTPYPARTLSEAKFQYAVKKYGARLPLSWEVMINNDLDAIGDIPNRFALSARRTENKFAVGLYVSSTGPNATFFSVGNGNIITGNPALSIAGLQTAFTNLYTKQDTDSEPILIEAVTLVVPPALAITARNILNATEIIIGADSADTRLLTTNWMRNNVTLVIEPYVSMINTTNGATSWYLFADPNVGRPALEMGFLRGYETPQLFMKSPNAVRVGGGGLVDPMAGDFDFDAIDYKIRHVLGGTQLDPKMAVASNGTNS